MSESCKRIVLLGFLGAVALCGNTGWAATLAGSVFDENGDHPPVAYVLAISTQDGLTVASGETVNGRFVFSLPDDSDIYLVAVGFSGEVLDGYTLHGYTIGTSRLVVGSGLVTHHIHVRTCHELILEGRRSDGSVISLDDLSQGSVAVDGRGEAVVEGLMFIDGTGNAIGAPSLCIPVGEERRLYLRYELPGAGRLNLPFDRGGEPFFGVAQTAEIVDLNEILARSQLARLDRLAAKLDDQGEEIPGEYDSAPLWIRFHDALGLAAGPRASNLDAVSSDAVRMLEDLHLWKADRAVSVVRRGRLDVEVRDLQGSPIPDVVVEYRQLSHDFGFGVFEPLAEAGEESYDLLRAAGLNSVTAGYYWKYIESSPGEIDWDYIDTFIGVQGLNEDAWRVKGHPLTWFSEIAMPEYVDALSFDELKQASVTHVSEIVSHYRGTVALWDVSNEASGIAGSGGLNRDEMDDYLEAVFGAARAADPDAGLILNNHFDPFGHGRIEEYAAAGDEMFTLSVPAFVRRCQEAGVDFDVVGQQLYNGGAVTRLEELGLGPVQSLPTYDLGFVADFLDALASSGKPIHITEHSVPSAWDAISQDLEVGYWRQPWSEEVQAEYMDAFLRLAFAHPSVRSITWWNALDRGAVVTHGGLIRPDGTAKPALTTLSDRIAGWTTQGSAATNGDGEVGVSGFAGDYELKIIIGDVEHRFEAHITEQVATPLLLGIDPFAVQTVRNSGRRRTP